MRSGRLIPLVLVCLLLCCGRLHAASWYQLEVIVFEHLHADHDGELWYDNPGLPDRSGAIPLVHEFSGKSPQATTEAETGALIPYQVLARGHYRLAGVERVLKLSRDYRPLLHIAWQQPVLRARAARAVYLANTPFEERTATAARQEGVAAFDNSERRDAGMVYEGIIRLRSSNLLHVEVDFSFAISHFADEQRLPGQAPGQSQGPSLFNQQYADYARLTETRRVKLNEIHYFDHPLFGIILQVSRFKKNP